jgi:hypothetical protein
VSQDTQKPASPTATPFKTSNATLIKWMLSQALCYPWRCLWLMALNLVLMGIGLAGITLTGLIFDILRWSVDTTGKIAPPKLWHFTLPDQWLGLDMRYQLVAA